MKVQLKVYRVKRGLNQRELSEKSGVPQPMISDIESGNVRAPRVDTLHKLALALKCTIDDLIEDGADGKSA